MKPGLRQHKSAECRISIAYGLPDEMQDQTREILAVKAGNPRKGHATALLHTLCVEADRDWITLIIQVKPFGDGMDEEQLRKFYSKFGFVVFQDFPLAVLMARSPQDPVIERLH